MVQVLGSVCPPKSLHEPGESPWMCQEHRVPFPQPGHSQGTGDVWNQELLEPIPGVSTSCANLVLTLPLGWSSGFRSGFLALGGELGKWWRGGLGMGRAPAGSGFTASPFLQCCWKSQAEQGWRFTAEGFAILPFPSVSVRWLWSRASELPSWCFWASRCLWELSEPCTVLCLCH